MIAAVFNVLWNDVEHLPISQYNAMAEQAMNQLYFLSGRFEFQEESTNEKKERFRAKIKEYEGQ